VDRFGISIGVSPREPLRGVGDLAREIDSAGFEAIWVIDFQLGMKDVYAAMAVIALATERVSIGPGVTNLLTRHPTITANAMTALDELSNGRAMLGLGAGWSAVLAAGRTPSRLADIRTGIESFRALFSGSEVKLDGALVQLATALRAVPIYIAASQPGMLRLAGELADGVILMGAADAEFCRWQLGFIHEGLKKGGRARGEVVIDLQVTMSIDENPQRALSDVRAWATSQAATFVDWKQLPPSYERYRPEFARAAETYHLVDHLSLHAQHKGVVSDEFVRRVAIAGSEGDSIDRLRSLAEMDIDRVTFALLSGGRRRRLEQLANRVIPALRGRPATA